MKPAIKRIISENNDFQRVEVLKRNRKKRTQYNEFFVEGVKSINNLVNNNWKVKEFVYSREKSLSRWAEEILSSSKADSHLELPLKLMDKLSDKEDGSEIIAIVEMPENDLSRIPIQENLLIVVFDRPSSHGNLGTLIRSCEALKVDGIVITGHAVDLYDPKTIRASMGTFFSMPTVRLDSHSELAEWFGKIKQELGMFHIVGSTSKAEHYIMDEDLSGPLALLIGNETYGLSHGYKEMCDLMVKIPMYGEITSFNVSCAASIMLYEIDRQRRLKLK